MTDCKNTPRERAKRSRKTTMAVVRTASSISKSLDKMLADLPEDEAPQEAIDRVVWMLAKSQPWFMQLIMEDPDIRESYLNSVAEIPVRLPELGLKAKK
jgi:hypothetical protein